MNPYEQIRLTPYEQELRDEVIYLHSLWHQGPPPPPQNPPYRTQINNSLYHPPRTINLSVSNPTPFKRTKRNKPRKPISNYPYSGSDPGKEWPVESPPDPACSGSTSGWPSFKANNLRYSDEKVSSLELAEIAKKQMQQRVVKVCNEFFGKRVGLDGGGGDEFDEEDEDEDYIDDDDDDDCEVEESEEFKFLLSLFVENGELRKFYEGNLESGDFYCLVCGGVGEKVGKKFKGSKSLVQHAISISKTKRRRVHRVFAQVICRVLGWDFGRFPIIALKGETLSQSLANSGQNLSQSLANSGQT